MPSTHPEQRLTNSTGYYATVLGCLLLSVQAFQPSVPIHGGWNKASAVSSISSSELRYSATMDPPFSSSPDAATNFEKQMRKLVTTKKKSAPSIPEHVQEATNLEEFKALVGDEQEQIVAVRWYATWCRACKAVAPAYYKLGKKNPSVKLVQVPTTKDNAVLHQGVGIPSVPYGHIYHPVAGLVEEMKLNKRTVGAFEQILQSYLTGSCDLEEDVDPYTKTYEAPYVRKQ